MAALRAPLLLAALVVLLAPAARAQDTAAHVAAVAAALPAPVDASGGVSAQSMAQQAADLLLATTPVEPVVAAASVASAAAAPAPAPAAAEVVAAAPAPAPAADAPVHTAAGIQSIPADPAVVDPNYLNTGGSTIVTQVRGSGGGTASTAGVKRSSCHPGCGASF